MRATTSIPISSNTSAMLAATATAKETDRARCAPMCRPVTMAASPNATCRQSSVAYGEYGTQCDTSRACWTQELSHSKPTKCACAVKRQNRACSAGISGIPGSGITSSSLHSQQLTTTCEQPKMVTCHLPTYHHGHQEAHPTVQQQLDHHCNDV